MNSILLKNARILDPDKKTDRTGNLLIEDGRIQTPGEDNTDERETSEREIDVKGSIVCPGLLDLYARLREPGQEKKATIASETRAALHGGITTIICSPDTDPVIDETATVELIHRRVEDAGFAQVVPLAALTQKLDGEQIGELATLIDAGCVAASNAEQPIANTRVLRLIMEYAATFDIKLMFVAQDSALAGRGVMHEGLISTRLGLIGIPVAAETVALGMIMELAWQTGARVHFSRISSARGIELIRNAKESGLQITADTSINHLFLTDEHVTGFNSLCHVNPPLRTSNDRDCLRQAIKDGTLDAICTDHAPHDPDAKQAPFPSTEPGISGLDIFLPLLLKLGDEIEMPLEDVIALASTHPAKIMDLPGGTLEPGSPAEIIVFDPDIPFVCDTTRFISKGRNSPYEGLSLRGQVKHCILGDRHIELPSGDDREIIDKLSDRL